MEDNNLIDLLKIIEEKHHKLDYNYDGINIWYGVIILNISL